MLIECASKQRAREILNDQADELPWAALALRSDLTLNADWHGCPLNDVEKRVLAEQANETAHAKARSKDEASGENATRCRPTGDRAALNLMEM